jgi:hypothetical protein
MSGHRTAAARTLNGVLNLALALVRRRSGIDHLCQISLCSFVSVKLCFSSDCVTV